MARLNKNTVLPETVRLPLYERAALRPGILHIGLGAFHRAHQAVHTDAALARDFGDWGIVGVSLRSTEIAQTLKDQDCLYSVITRDASGDSACVIGSIIDTIAAAQNGQHLSEWLADPAIRIVSLTVTEKAYGLDPLTGGLDRNHPAVAADIAEPDAPTGVIGLLVHGFAHRREAGVPPFTVLCCDNLPNNGRIVRRLVLEMAALRDVSLASWIEQHARFPSSMVDRIVPAATDATLVLAGQLLGTEDRMAVETEPFSQWVIEDDFVSGRPAWQAGGALFVSSVEPYERMKLRLLNGSHSLIAYHSQLRGVDLVRDAIRRADLAALVRAHMKAVLPTLDPVPGIDLASYCEELIARFANPAIAHRTKQIAMDGSQKLPPRIFLPAREALAGGEDADSFALVTALWLAYLVKADAIDDPRAPALLEAAQATRDPDDPTAAFFGVKHLFPEELVTNRAWRDRVNAHFSAVS